MYGEGNMKYIEQILDTETGEGGHGTLSSSHSDSQKI